MNARLNELFEQAALDLDEDPLRLTERFVSMCPGFMEKFAELIVKECVKIDDSTDYTLGVGEQFTVGSKIEQRFGLY